MINKKKTDPVLGQEIHQVLMQNDVETPMKPPRILQGETANHDDYLKRVAIEESFKDIMHVLGLDLTDDSLIGTPKRIAKMFIDEIYYGLDYDNFPKATVVENKMRYNELVVVKDIKSMSSCEHHFVTIDGFCHVAYLPGKKVLGLSKINRIVDFFSRRPQIQERLTLQIFYALCHILETEDVAVILNGVHFCVKSRGVGDQTSSTVTSKMGGLFMANPALRAEFLELTK